VIFALLLIIAWEVVRIIQAELPTADIQAAEHICHCYSLHPDLLPVYAAAITLAVALLVGIKALRRYTQAG